MHGKRGIIAFDAFETYSHQALKMMRAKKIRSVEVQMIILLLHYNLCEG